ISLLQRQKEENLRNIKQICVQARNRFSKRRIREDFHRSLRELGRWDPEGEEEEEDEDSSNAEETPDPFSLRVFTVSSKEYLDLRRRDPQEGRICVFNTEEDTGRAVCNTVSPYAQRSRLSGTLLCRAGSV
ncbi:hypothetical protein FKM82_019590, partial [Ascaphus truei]